MAGRRFRQPKRFLGNLWAGSYGEKVQNGVDSYT